MEVQQGFRLDFKGRRSTLAKPFLLAAFLTVTLFVSVSQETSLWTGAFAAPTEEPSNALSTATDLVLDLLERHAIDMTDIIATSRPCCVRRRFERKVYDVVGEILDDSGFSSSVDTADVTDKVLALLRRKHWTYKGNTADPEEKVYKALEAQTKDTSYFSE